MARTTNALTDRKIRSLIAAGGPSAKSDGQGLTLTVSATGTAVWVLRYRHGGRRRELTIGRFPDVSLQRARQDASDARVRVGRGADVAIEKRRAKTASHAEWTVRDVVNDYEANVLSSLAVRTQGNMKAYWLRDILPTFGAWLVRDVTAKDAQAWLKNIDKKRSYQAAANARRVAIAIGEHAIAANAATSNPFRVSLRVVGKKPETRQRIKLEPEEVRAFLGGLEAIPEQDALALRVLLLTGCRANELFRAEWSEVDLKAGVWRLPAKRLKTGKGMKAEHFEIRLPGDGIAWFRRLHELAGGSRWVLPSPMTKGATATNYTTQILRLQAVLAKAKGVPAITHHDLRATARSYWSELKVRTEIMERMLNHSLGGLLAVYDKGDFSDERLEALEKWAAKLRALEHGDDTNVVPIRGRK